MSAATPPCRVPPLLLSLPTWGSSKATAPPGPEVNEPSPRVRHSGVAVRSAAPGVGAPSAGVSDVIGPVLRLGGEHSGGRRDGDGGRGHRRAAARGEPAGHARHLDVARIPDRRRGVQVSGPPAGVAGHGPEQPGLGRRADEVHRQHGRGDPRRAPAALRRCPGCSRPASRPAPPRPVRSRRRAGRRCPAARRPAPCHGGRPRRRTRPTRVAADGECPTATPTPLRRRSSLPGACCRLSSASSRSVGGLVHEV